MRKPKENDQYVKAVEYSHTLERLLIMERENSAALRSELASAERERDELKQRLANAEHQLHMAELAKFNLRNQRKAQFRKRREAEAEIVRRDAAAGDSRKIFTCSGCGAEGLDEPLESRCHCCIDGAHWVEGKLYTAAPPAVLPPAISTEGLDPDSKDIDEVRNLAHIEGANWMRQQYLELGAQQQKVVELPEPVKWPEIPFKYFSEEQVFSMLDAAGVKWEVKK